MNQRKSPKPSKFEREREMYARMGMKHPKDQILDFQLDYLKRWLPTAQQPADPQPSTPEPSEPTE